MIYPEYKDISVLKLHAGLFVVIFMKFEKPYPV